MPRQRITDARADLKKHPVTVIVDPAGKRVSEMLGIEQEAYNRWQPILLPVGLQLGGLLFIWLAFSGSSPRQDDRPVPGLSPRPKTKREQILDLHQKILQVDGSAPSQAWIAKQVSCAKSTVSRALAET